MTTRILLITYVWPEKDASAAGVRDLSLIRAFQREGWEVTCISPSIGNRHSEQLEQMGVRTHSFQANDSAFNQFVSELRPDFVLMDRFVIEEQFGWRVRESSPASVCVLDTQDLHFLRRARQAALATGVALEDIFDARLELATEDALREIASIYRSDCALILSEYEHRLLQERFGVPRSLLELSPFFYPPPLHSPPDFESRRDFVMIGNFRHPPNADAAVWLREAIWPGLRKALPEAEVHVYGAYPPKEIMKLDDPKTGFRVIGPARDAVETLMRYRVNLAPLRFGAGIKGKIADGWWCGTPAVSTPIGAEGMQYNGLFGGLIARETSEFARAAARLYTNPIEWKHESEKGREILKAIFDERKNAQALIHRLASLRESLEAHRKSNFIGRMLSHHFHKSTTYMSRWIELKATKTSRRETPP